MAGTIGIKIANGEFYPLLEENSPAKKKLTLTTVHDRQKSVQIDLFRSISKTMLDAQYIGSIVVENIRPKTKGEPSIEMVISSDIDGNIAADAVDIETGEHHALNVALESGDFSYSDDDFNDFDPEYNKPQSSAVLFGLEKKPYEERKFPWMVMALATLFVILAISALWFFFLGGRDTVFSGRTSPQAVTQRIPPVVTPPAVETPQAATEAVTQAAPVQPAPVQPETVPELATPQAAAPQTTPAQPAPVQPVPGQPAPQAAPVAAPRAAPVSEPAPPVQETVIIRAPASPPPPRQETAQRTRPPAPVSSFRVPAVIPRNGVVYQIQWGDTLWDISEAFYRTPWMYPRIAQHNNIRNPDVIIAGFNIRIPPLN